MPSLPNPSPVEVGHTTGVYVPYSFRTVVLVLLRPTWTDQWKCCETGPTVFRPYQKRVRRSNHLQMSLQRQHFLLSYLKTMSVGLAGFEPATSRTHRSALSQQFRYIHSSFYQNVLSLIFPGLHNITKYDTKKWSAVNLNQRSFLLRATRGAHNANRQVVITHAAHVCSQHSFGLPLRMYRMQRTHFDHARLDFLSLVIWSRVFWPSVTWTYAKHTVGAKVFGPSIVDARTPKPLAITNSRAPRAARAEHHS